MHHIGAEKLRSASHVSLKLGCVREDRWENHCKTIIARINEIGWTRVPRLKLQPMVQVPRRLRKKEASWRERRVFADPVPKARGGGPRHDVSLSGCQHLWQPYRCSSGNVMAYPMRRVLYQRPQTRELPADLRQDMVYSRQTICFKSQHCVECINACIRRSAPRKT